MWGWIFEDGEETFGEVFSFSEEDSDFVEWVEASGSVGCEFVFWVRNDNVLDDLLYGWGFEE